MNPILGRLINVKIHNSSGSGITNLNKEQSSSLSISHDFVKGAGSSSKTLKNYPQKKSWSISSSMLFNLSDFIELMDQMQKGSVFSIAFEDKNGLDYGGDAFPTHIKLQGEVHSLIKMQVQWQGTGPLYVN